MALILFQVRDSVVVITRKGILIKKCKAKIGGVIKK